MCSVLNLLKLGPLEERYVLYLLNHLHSLVTIWSTDGSPFGKARDCNAGFSLCDVM